MITAELPGAHWSDTFTLDVPQGGLDAERAARLALDRIPVWAQVLMRLRNALVAPFGLKAAPDGTLPPEASIGTFPVISRAPDKVVLGLDDKHLDFRIVITVDPASRAPQRVSATTMVRINNGFGRAYLAAVMPFHKLIVPVTLRQILKGV
ncbi:MAG: DUF2867 domain-containing protein [Notoacmeibacter sp.]|nr:DUF2867 domain-containing protein [Notoacmeibacter sp.]MCC0033289.1 DUF2867 domain-containing protein [Brucellaceae bacterium]